MDLLYKIFIDPFMQMGQAPDLLVQTLWEGLVAGVLYSYDRIRRFSLPMDDSPAAAPSVPKSRRKRGSGPRSANLTASVELPSARHPAHQ